jgi:heat-inducible transcriptional repressor
VTGVQTCALPICRIQFLPLSDRRVLVILVVNQSEVQNRVISTDRPYGAD